MATMREALEQAYDTSDSDVEEAGGSTEDTTESLGATEEEETTEIEAVDAGATEGDDTGTGDTDDGTGGDVVQDTEHDNEVAAATATDIKAPVAWKPAVREHWNKLPTAVKEEVQRREQEIMAGMQSAAEAKKQVNAFYETIRPFESIMAAQNATPLEAVKSLMTTASGLYMGTAQQKAMIVCDVIKQYGVDINMLDSLLAGQMPPQGAPPAIASALEQQLAPVKEFMAEIQATRQSRSQQLSSSAEQSISSFAESHEFFEDVREDMADIMELAANRGRGMTMEQAYDQATKLNPDVAAVLATRNGTSSSALTANNLRRKKKAAASISGAPSGAAGSSTDDSIRGSLLAAMDAAE